MRLVVLGLGNPLMRDDGIGLALLARLQAEHAVPGTVELVDGGTWGMNLLPLIEEADRLLLLDAIDVGAPAGEPVRLTRDELPRYFAHKLSPHQIDLREVLALAELRGKLPRELVAVGVQPAVMEMGTELSPEADAGLAAATLLAARQIEAWGVECPSRGACACTNSA